MIINVAYNHKNTLRPIIPKRVKNRGGNGKKRGTEEKEREKGTKCEKRKKNVIKDRGEINCAKIMSCKTSTALYCAEGKIGRIYRKF